MNFMMLIVMPIAGIVVRFKLAGSSANANWKFSSGILYMIVSLRGFASLLQPHRLAAACFEAVR